VGDDRQSGEYELRKNRGAPSLFSQQGGAFSRINSHNSRSRWQHGLRCRPAAVGLLGLVSNPVEARLSVFWSEESFTFLFGYYRINITFRITSLHVFYSCTFHWHMFDYTILEGEDRVTKAV